MELPIDGATPVVVPASVPVVDAPRPRQPFICEFCECRLAPSGQVLERGERATTFQRQEDMIDQLNEKIARVEGERNAAIRERDEARAAVSPKKKSIWG